MLDLIINIIFFVREEQQLVSNGTTHIPGGVLAILGF